MTMQTIAQEILADSHTLVTTTDVYRKIVAAMRFHTEKRLWFSERTFSFTLVQGQYAYDPGNGPPADLYQVVGKVLWVLVNGSQNQRLPIVRVPSAEFDSARQFGTSQDRPSIWDYYGKQLRFYPTPNSDPANPDTCEGRYVTDISYPICKWVNGTFVFYAPDGARQLSQGEIDGWRNDWTDARGAAHMIRSRASYMIYRDILKDNDAADQWLNTWLEQVAALEDETESRTAGRLEVAPCIIDSPDGGWW